jgi:hypothetical protein
VPSYFRDNTLVEASPDGWLYQTSSYIDYTIFEGAISLSFAVLSDTDQLLAVCPLYLSPFSEQPVIKFSHQILNRAARFLVGRALFQTQFFEIVTGYSGPVLDPSYHFKARNRLLREVYLYIDRLALRHRCEDLQVRLCNIAPSQLTPYRPGFNPLWLHGICDPYVIPSRLTVILDLSRDEAELKRDLDEDCRSEISKAERVGVTFREGTKDDLPLFHAIHRESWNRTMGHHQSYQHFELMRQYMGYERFRLFFAEHAGKAVSAILLHLYKKNVFYWGGCSLKEAQAVKANNFLLFSAVKWAKAQGCSFFEIGIFQSFPGDNLKEYTVGQYKAQFSKNYLEVYEGRKNYTRRAEKTEYTNRLRLLGLRARASSTQKSTSDAITLGGRING